MPPKTKFTKKDVVQAAFDIVQEQGIQKLTARKVAQKLKSSTAPVYSHFERIDILEREVIKKAKDLLFQHTTIAYTDRVFLNMGTGYAIFARDQSKLFRAIFLERDDFKDIVDEFLIALKKELVKDTRFTAMSAKDRDALLTKMWIFTHGLASLICVGLVENICEGVIDEISDECIIQILSDVGSSVIGAALAKSQKRDS